MILENLFYKLMYRKRTIKFKAISGRNYIVEYHRTPFWTYEERTLKLFFKEKFNSWHGQVWEVFKNGGQCGFGTWYTQTIFPRRKMKEFLIAEVRRLERIFNKENTQC